MKKIQLFFILLISLSMFSCRPMTLKSIDKNDEFNDYFFILKTNREFSNSDALNYYKSLPYVSNISIINGDVVFTYKNDMNPIRISMTQDMFPNYMKNLYYVMKVSIYRPFVKNKFLCSNILIYDGDSLIMNSLPDDKKQEIIKYITRFTIKDLEYKY